MVNFFKSLKLRWSDLAIIIGFAFFVIFASYGQLFMYHQDPNNVGLSLAAAIPFFIVGLLAFAFVIAEAAFRKELPPNFVSGLFCVISFIGLIAILIQEDVYNFTGSTNVLINPINKTIFCFELILLILFLYCGFFIYSKRFPNFKFIIVFSYICFLFLLVVAIYSYITEGQHIVNYFQVLFGYKEGGLTPIASFLINPNAVGMVMLMGMLLAFIVHSIKPRWWYYLLAFYFFINILFTHCRGSLYLAVAVFVAFVFFRLFYFLKQNKKQGTILLIVASSLVLVAFILLIIVVGLNGKFLPHIHHAITAITDTKTIGSRFEIYETCFVILDGGEWLLGKGFGTFNLILTNVFGNNRYVLPAHNAFIAVLGEGGVVFLLAFLILLAYTIYISIKSYRLSPKITYPILLGVGAFFIYSFIETIQYIMYFYIFVLLMAQNILSKKYVEE